MARHIYRCPLRWGDMDAYGHINNVVYLRYLEEARVDLMFRLGAREARAGFGTGCVVARHEIDYLRPLAHREAVTIETWVTKISAASVTLAYEVKDDERVYARAVTVIVPFDLAESRVRRLSPEETAFMERWRDEVPAGGATTDEEAVAV